MHMSRLQRLVEGTELSAADENRMLSHVDPDTLRSIAQMLVTQRRELRKELVDARAERAQVEMLAEKLRTPPWYPGTVLRVSEDGRVDVVSNGRRQLVVTGPDVETAELRPGDEVLLSENGLVAARNGPVARTGVVGTVSEVAADGVLVRGPGDEELRALCPPELSARLRAGDRVLCAAEFPYVLEQLPERTQSRWILETPPAFPFERLGGLDGLIAEIRRDLDLHLLHHERVAAYQLRLLRGMLLIGPPGVGKTSLAAAIAHYLSQTRSETRFLHVPPGAIRGMYYGEAERRIRELFGTARRAPGLVVIFIDELDSYGMRGAGIGQDIDGRVLGALLDAIDGLGSARNVLLVGATNRLDLCDLALVRHGRFGDRMYDVPRPGREATRQILASYLGPDLPYAMDGRDGAEAADAMIEAVAAYLHAPEGGAGTIASVTLRNSERRPIQPAQVLSGALIESAVERAKHAAAQRHVEQPGGLLLEDLLAAFDDALHAEARKLATPHVARQLLEIEGADEIVLVDLPSNRRVRPHRYLRAA